MPVSVFPPCQLVLGDSLIAYPVPVSVLQEAKELQEPPPPLDDVEEEEEEMFFTEPQQLLELYAHLEEQNLFLIQNVQETEEALEEMKNKYRDTKGRLESETEALKAQIHNLELGITVERQKERLLKEGTIQNVGGFKLSGNGGAEVTLDQLNEKVRRLVFVDVQFLYILPNGLDRANQPFSISNTVTFRIHARKDPR